MAHEKVLDRQSFVTTEGDRVEKEIISILKGNEKIAEKAIISQGPSHRQKSDDFMLENTPIDINELFINYSDGKYIIDADIIVYSKEERKIICVISSKKSFRERGSQTAYWATKINQNHKNFKYILVTPDVDNELYNPDDESRINKWRGILTDEMDSVFVIEPIKELEDGNIKINYEKTYTYREKFYVGNMYLVEYIKKLLGV